MKPLASHRGDGVVLVKLLAALGVILLLLLLGAAGSRAATPVVDAFPIPGAQVAAPSTQITLRGVPVSQFGTITVTGSATGAHAGVVRSDSDNMGGSFLPSKPFAPGETVTVQTSLNIAGASHGTFTFKVASPAGATPAAPRKPLPHAGADVWRFASRPDLTPAAATVVKQPSHTAPGDLFVASQQGPLQNGPELLGPYGGLIYFQAVPQGDSATDFRVQTYDGKPVLTWWQGMVSAAGIGQGQDEIYDSSYRPVATVQAGNGLKADLHEFQISAHDTALITAAWPVYWDASSVKGASKHEIVLDSVVQEIDIPTGLVMYQWDSLDHVPVSASYQPPPAASGNPWDYFHVNSVQAQTDDSLLVSSRDTWAIYKVSLQTGAINWTIGGKHPSFKMGRNTAFAFQHDALRIFNGQFTIFDDGAGPPTVHSQSRAITLNLNLQTRTVTLVRQDEHTPPLLADYEGNVQRLSNGDDFVGWGQQPYFSEFNSAGKEVFDARFVGPTSSYRAYRFVWTGAPVTPPAVAVRVTRAGVRTVYASWNGTTTTAKWRVLGGPSPGSLTTVLTAGKAAFETAMRLPHAYHYVEVQALSAQGKVLGTSGAVKG